jgi:hypothetical protein
MSGLLWVFGVILWGYIFYKIDEINHGKGKFILPVCFIGLTDVGIAFGLGMLI